MTVTETLQPDFEPALRRIVGDDARCTAATLIPGGASKESWCVDAVVDGSPLPLLVRRDAANSAGADSGAVDLQTEYALLRAVHAAGVKVARPWGVTDDLDGRPAVIMDRLEGTSIGPRVVRSSSLATAREQLPQQLAEALAGIHSVPLNQLPPLPGRDEQAHPALAGVTRLRRELDRADEAHPAIELGLTWLHEHAPRDVERTLVHGDFRIGNLMIDEHGLAGVLDWELAHVGNPAEDLGWPLIRAWRFGQDHLRLGGTGEVEPFLEHYNQLSGRQLTPADLFYWELMGNVRWAVICVMQSRRHLEGSEADMELAVLGRITAEVEREIIHLLEQA